MAAASVGARHLGRVVVGVIAIALAAASVAAWAEPPAKTFTVTVEKKRIDIGDGMTYDAWTFDGIVPGPQLRLREGDEVSVQLLNHTPDAHGLNIHAAQISPQHFGGDTKGPLQYKFRADVAGVFVYHCNGIPILDHIGRGMYGPVIVDPKDGWPSGPAQEITVVQSEFYGTPRANGRIIPDHTRMLEANPSFVVFNGQLNKSGAEHPISIKVGKLVRVFFINAGPNLVSTFHVAGAMFSAVYPGGNPANVLRGTDHLVVGPSTGAVFEFKVSEPGDYRFMDLNRAHEYNGAMGVLRAEP
jgi:nitrite reductase (NO-forming)